MTDQPPTIDRTPYCTKIRYGITGAPILTADEMDGTFAPGVGVRPTLIELVYSPARDGKPACVDASVTGDWMRFGKPEEFGGQVTTHFKSGPDGWPVWLAEEVRLHDPEAETELLRAELAAFEMLAPQQCPAGKHADWLVDSEYAHACPWCRIAELSAAVAPDATSEATSAPLRPSQPSSVSESAQSPTGAPERALRADAFRAEGSGR